MNDVIIKPIGKREDVIKKIRHYQPYYDDKNNIIYLKDEIDLPVTIWHEMMHKIFGDNDFCDDYPGERVSHAWDTIGFELAYFLFSSTICYICIEEYNFCPQRVNFETDKCPILNYKNIMNKYED